MKKFMIFLAAIALSLNVACDSPGGGGTPTGEGGPDVSPDNVQTVLSENGDNNENGDTPINQVDNDVTDQKDDVANDVVKNSDVNELTIVEPKDTTDDQDDPKTPPPGDDPTTDDKDEKVIKQVDSSIEEALKSAASGNFVKSIGNLKQLLEELKKSDSNDVVNALIAKINDAIKKIDELKKTYDSEQLKIALADIDSILDKVSDSISSDNTDEAKKLLDEALTKAKSLADADAKSAAVAKVEKAIADLDLVIKQNATSKEIADAIASGDFSKALDAASEITDDAALANALVTIINGVAGKDNAKKILKKVKKQAKKIANKKIKNNVIEQANLQLAATLQYELIPQEGKWFKAAKKELFTKDEWKAKTVQIKAIRKQIKALKAKRTKENKKAINAKIKALRKEIADVKAKFGYARIQKGIWTPWSKRDLILRITNVPADGWYNIIVVAKNAVGKIPASYKAFNIAVANETLGTNVGGMTIPASEAVYHKGKVLVKLEKGDTDLNLKWTNDYYKKGKYDANINIRKVVVKYAKNKNKKSKKLVRKAHEYSAVNGRWFWNHNSVYTFWKNQSITFSFSDVKSGKYELIIVAKNYGDKLPSDYEFKLNIFADGLDTEGAIKAAKKWKRSKIIIDLTGGDTDVEISWLNDKYKKGVYDTNIQIKKIKLKRVGDSERSAIAAYLLGTSAGSRVLLIGTLFLLIIIIGGISVLNRRKTKSEEA